MSNQEAGLRTSTFPEQVQLWFWCTCKAGHCKAGQPGLCISARRLHIQSRPRTLSLVARYRLAVAACPEAAGSAHAATRAQRRAPSSVLSESRMTVWFVSRSDDMRAIAQHAALHKSVGNSIESVPENFTALKSWKPGENHHRSAAYSRYTRKQDTAGGV